MTAPSAAAERRRDWPLVLALALIFVLPAACWLPFPGVTSVRAMQAGYLVACLGWLFVIYRGGGSRGLSLYRSDAAPRLRVVLAAALAARLMLLPAAPSDDVYRYAWEGLVRVEGFNPYVAAPDDAALEPLRPDWWGRINHPNHAAIYPPLAQCLFAALAWLAPDPFVFKTLMLLAEGAAIGFMLLWLRRSGQPPQRIAIYALCPLALTGIAREGHLDALMLLGLAMMLAYTAGQRPLTMRDAILAAAGLGLAIGTKWIAIVLAPWLVMRAWRPFTKAQGLRTGVAALVAGLLVGAPAALYLDHGWWAIVGPLRYFSVEFHSLDYVRQQLAMLVPADAVNTLSAIALIIVAFGLAAARTNASTAICWTLGAVIVLAPTVHPWYLLWVLPALCYRVSVPWLVLTLTMVLAYEGDHRLELTGVWSQPAWVAPAVWWPFIAALLLVSLRRGATLLARPLSPSE